MLASSCSTLALETTAARGMWTRVDPASRSTRDCSPDTQRGCYMLLLHYLQVCKILATEKLPIHIYSVLAGQQEMRNATALCYQLTSACVWEYGGSEVRRSGHIVAL